MDKCYRVQTRASFNCLAALFSRISLLLHEFVKFSHWPSFRPCILFHQNDCQCQNCRVVMLRWTLVLSLLTGWADSNCTTVPGMQVYTVAGVETIFSQQSIWAYEFTAVRQVWKVTTLTGMWRFYRLTLYSAFVIQNFWASQFSLLFNQLKS